MVAAAETLHDPSEASFVALELAGRIIMENGGETYRVEDTVYRMGIAFGWQQVACFAVPSGVFITCANEAGAPRTAIIRVHATGTNLTRVDAVNTISRKAAANQITPEQAIAELRELRTHKPLVTGWRLAIAAGFSAGAFSLMFFGDAIDFLLAFLVAGLVQMLSVLPDRLNIDTLAHALIGAFISMLLPTLLQRITGIGHVEPIVAGALMPLLPGLKMTTAVQDLLRGDMISGASNGLAAILIATLVAVGALAAFAFADFLLGGVML